jgi:hypothetical protein
MPTIKTPPLKASIFERLGELEAAKLAREVEQEAERARIGNMVNKVPEEPNFQLVGEPQSHDFTMQGEPYGGNVATIPKARVPDEILPPEGGNNLPALAATGAGMPVGNVEVRTDGTIVKKPMNKALKYGGLGAIGLGAGAAILGGSANPNEDQAQRTMAAGLPEEPIKPYDSDAAATESAYKNLLNALQAKGKERKPIEIDMGDATSLGGDADLVDAQQRAANARLVSGMGKAGDIIGSAIAGTKASPEIFDEQIKRSDNITKDHKDRVANQKNDPNSAVSKAMRAQFEKMGFKFKGAISAADLEEQLSSATTLFNAEENRESREKELAVRAAIAQMDKTKSRSDKKDQFVQALRKEATAGQLGKVYENFVHASRMTEALEQFSKDPTGYSDYGSLMGSLKALQMDPSVVREAEIRLGMNATSLANKVQNWSERLISGKQLQPEQRQEMIKAIQVLAGTAQRQYVDAARPLFNQAEMEGIDPRVIFDPRLAKSFNPAQQQQAPARPKTIKQNGHTYTLNEKTGQYE